MYYLTVIGVALFLATSHSKTSNSIEVKERQVIHSINLKMLKGFQGKSKKMPELLNSDKLKTVTAK